MVVDIETLPTSDTFHPFTRLPAELRIKVWRLVLRPGGYRTIRVLLARFLEKSIHRCNIDEKKFCGSHTSCEGPGLPKPIYTLVGGYLRMAPGVMPSDDMELMRIFNLTCQESRQQVLECYPDIMKVHQGKYGYSPCRYVRYNSATDVIVFSVMGEVEVRPVGQTDPFICRDTKCCIHNDLSTLQEFRSTLATFQTVVCVGIGTIRGLIEDDITSGESEFDGDLVMFMPSLQKLFLCPAHIRWGFTMDDLVWLENINDLGDEELDWMIYAATADYSPLGRPPPQITARARLKWRSKLASIQVRIASLSCIANLVHEGDSGLEKVLQSVPQIGYCRSWQYRPETDV